MLSLRFGFMDLAGVEGGVGTLRRRCSFVGVM